jgi:beta-ureidopropionase / N-carbamoyl-L-amino-acid hydrolase
MPASSDAPPCPVRLLDFTGKGSENAASHSNESSELPARGRGSWFPVTTCRTLRRRETPVELRNDADSNLAVALPPAVDGSMPLASMLFDELRRRTGSGDGVTRDSYGPGEQAAHDLFEEAARSLGLAIAKDPAGNLYMTYPGRDGSLPAWFVGSHLDSVLHGGNYDGAAGVVAGLTTIAALQRLGLRPLRDLTVMAIRAEECSTWFVGHHGGHLGSRAALGLLDVGELESAVHVRSGKTLARCMDDAGFDSSYFRGSAGPYLRRDRIRGYFELHIEQGPVLEHRGFPIGIVTGIRGALRARSARTIGGYTHSGAVPHELRQDAVLATAELVHALDDSWTRMREQGRDMVYTVGKFYTDQERHSIVKVPGEVSFALDIRSQDVALLTEMRGVVERLAADIGARRNVRIDLGEMSLVRPAVMDDGMRSHMTRGCAKLGFACMDIASGAGHDAADFHDAGIPSSMIFVRNANGSHNPDEAMAMADFRQGTCVLAWTLATSEQIGGAPCP